MTGILEARIDDTPIAVVDFETTGLTPGQDRVVEVAVVRRDPGGQPRVVLDTLINPARRMAATEIHGITDEDVEDAPFFEDIADEFVAAMSDCVVSAYNVYFDIRFLQYELGHTGVSEVPPHFCLMYMRPMLGLGSRCKLEEACRHHSIEYEQNHVAANDAQASAELLEFYLQVLRDRQVSTFSELAQLKSYKFTKSFTNPPLRSPTVARSNNMWSRIGHIPERPIDPVQKAIRSYWDTLTTVVADLQITEEELEYVIQERKRLRLPKEEIRVLHARAFESAISQFVDDEWLDDKEVRKLRFLHRALSRLGWAPGD